MSGAVRCPHCDRLLHTNAQSVRWCDTTLRHPQTGGILGCGYALPTPAQTASGVEPIVADIARRIANGELESQQ